MNARLSAIMVPVAALLSSCEPPKNSDIDTQRYTYIPASKLAEDIGFGGGDALSSIVTGLANYRKRCEPYDGKEILTEIGVISAAETAANIKRVHIVQGDQLLTVEPRLQTQPPGTARPFGRTVWVDVSKSPKFVDDMIAVCRSGNICNYRVAGYIRYDPSKMDSINGKNTAPLDGCMLVVERYKYLNQNGFYSAIVKSAAVQAIGNHFDDVVANLNPGR